MISLEDDIVQSMERALIFGAFLNELARPTPAQIWLANAAEQLRAGRDPDGSKRDRRDRIIFRLTERDGHDCWYCGKPLGQDVTIEHLTPLALSGDWKDDNLVLAHRRCNRAAGHLSRIKKEHLRDQMRSEFDGPQEAERQSNKRLGITR